MHTLMYIFHCRFLATGNSYKSLAFSYRVAPSTVTPNKHTTNKNQYQKTDHFSDVVYLQIRMTDSDVKSDRYIHLFKVCISKYLCIHSMTYYIFTPSCTIQS